MRENAGKKYELYMSSGMSKSPFPAMTSINASLDFGAMPLNGALACSPCRPMVKGGSNNEIHIKTIHQAHFSRRAHTQAHMDTCTHAHIYSHMHTQRHKKTCQQNPDRLWTGRRRRNNTARPYRKVSCPCGIPSDGTRDVRAVSVGRVEIVGHGRVHDDFAMVHVDHVERHRNGRINKETRVPVDASVAHTYNLILAWKRT